MPIGLLQETHLAASAGGSQRYPMICYATTSGVHLVVWQEGYETWPDNTKIRGVIVSASGNQGSPFTISDAAGSQESPALCTNGTDFFVVWHDLRNAAGGSGYDVYGARVTSAGVVSDASGIAIATGIGNQCWPCVGFDGTNYVVAYANSAFAGVNKASYALYARLVSQGGVALGSGTLICGPTSSVVDAAYADNFRFVQMLSHPAMSCFTSGVQPRAVVATQHTAGTRWSGYYVWINTTGPNPAISGSYTILPNAVAYSTGSSPFGPLSAYATGGLSFAGNEATGRRILAFCGNQNQPDFMAAPLFTVVGAAPSATLEVKRATSNGDANYRSSVAANGDGWVIAWVRGYSYDSTPLGQTYQLCGATIDAANTITPFTTFGFSSTYRGYVTTAVGPSYGLMVYERMFLSGLRLIAVRWDRTGTPVGVSEAGEPTGDLVPPSAPTNLRLAQQVDVVITTLDLTSTQTGTLPFTVGLAFAKGEIPSQSYVRLQGDSTQVVVKRLWNDGSVKHAIASGHLVYAAPGTQTLNVLRSLNAPSGTALTSADIQTAAPTASVTITGFGTVTLSDLLATPFRTWISGSEMVECHYRSAVGADTGLDVWFYVRLYKNGRMWIRAIVENGYINVHPNNIAKTYVPQVVIGGVTVYNNGGASLIHYKNTRWTAEGWIGGDPDITPKHNVTHLRSTKLVPNYWKRSPTEAGLNRYLTSYTPMSNVNLTALMGTGGWQDQIGILPWWEALYCTTGDARPYRACLANASAINSYPISWRDSNTQLPASPVAWPNFGLGSYDWIAGSLTWEWNHQPSEGYLAYLLTGDYWYYESALFGAAFCYLILSTAGRGTGVNKIFIGPERGIGWSYRTVFQAIAIAPEGDAVAADYRTLVSNNMVYWKGVKDHVGMNQMGYLHTSNLNGYGHGLTSTWMQHYWIAAMGHGSDIEPLADMTVFNEVRNYQYLAPVGILGDASGYCFNYGGAHPLMTNDDTEGAIYMQPWTWFADWATVWARSWPLLPSCENTLQTVPSGSIQVGPPSGAPMNTWGYLLPAIAYAADHGAPGAAVSWVRLSGATNWSDIETAGFDNNPTWGIVPRSYA